MFVRVSYMYHGRFFSSFGYVVISFFLCGFNSCCPEPQRPSFEEIWENCVKSTKRLESGCYRYSIWERVVLQQPLYCRLISWEEAIGSREFEKYVGYGLLNYACENEKKKPEYGTFWEIATGREITIVDFFVEESKDHPGREYYFVQLILPDETEWNVSFIYFMGYDNKMISVPGGRKKKRGMERKFNPVDIEKIFPGGVWYPRKNVQ